MSEEHEQHGGNADEPILGRGLGTDIALTLGAIAADDVVLGPYLDAGREWVVDQFKQNDPPPEPIITELPPPSAALDD